MISIRLRPDVARQSVDNFVALARSGYFDGLAVYRVCPHQGDATCVGNLVATGDPLNDGTGGPGYELPLEPVQGRYLLGAVAMETSGNQDSGSRFWISRGDSRALPARSNLFGQVTSGLEVLSALSLGTRIDWVAVVTGV